MEKNNTNVVYKRLTECAAKTRWLTNLFALVRSRRCAEGQCASSALSFSFFFSLIRNIEKWKFTLPRKRKLSVGTGRVRIPFSGPGVCRESRNRHLFHPQRIVSAYYILPPPLFCPLPAAACARSRRIIESSFHPRPYLLASTSLQTRDKFITLFAPSRRAKPTGSRWKKTRSGLRERYDCVRWFQIICHSTCRSEKSRIFFFFDWLNCIGCYVSHDQTVQWLLKINNYLLIIWWWCSVFLINKPSILW